MGSSVATDAATRIYNSVGRSYLAPQLVRHIGVQLIHPSELVVLTTLSHTSMTLDTQEFERMQMLLNDTTLENRIGKWYIDELINIIYKCDDLAWGLAMKVYIMYRKQKYLTRWFLHLSVAAVEMC